MKTYLNIGIRLTLVTLIVFGIAFPLLISLVAKITPGAGLGEEIVVNNQVKGFELIGQKFDLDQYFNSRPSAVDYNAAATGGSNKGPTNAEYLAQVQARIDTFLIHNPAVSRAEIPVDLITASGGGLDPHISPQAAYVQVDRIASVRGIDKQKVKELVDHFVEKPLLGIGTERVHVLRLNLALDQLK